MVFTTYQAYLKGMEARVRCDLERAKREGYTLACKLVRGAYLVQVRASTAGLHVGSFPAGRRGSVACVSSARGSRLRANFRRP